MMKTEKGCADEKEKHADKTKRVVVREQSRNFTLLPSKDFVRKDWRRGRWGRHNQNSIHQAGADQVHQGWGLP